MEFRGNQTMARNKNRKSQNRGALQSYRLTLPAGTVLPSGLPAALAPTTPEESPAAISVEYPRMCRRLRDLGLRFQFALARIACPGEVGPGRCHLLRQCLSFRPVARPLLRAPGRSEERRVGTER